MPDLFSWEVAEKSLRASWRRWQGNLKERKTQISRDKKVRMVLAKRSMWSLEVGKFQAHSLFSNMH